MSAMPPEEIQKGLKLVIKDSMVSQAMSTLSAGTFLVAFALELGASNLVIGILAGLTPSDTINSIAVNLFSRKI